MIRISAEREKEKKKMIWIMMKGDLESMDRKSIRIRKVEGEKRVKDVVYLFWDMKKD